MLSIYRRGGATLASWPLARPTSTPTGSLLPAWAEGLGEIAPRTFISQAPKARGRPTQAFETGFRSASVQGGRAAGPRDKNCDRRDL